MTAMNSSFSSDRKNVTGSGTDSGGSRNASEQLGKQTGVIADDIRKMGVLAKDAAQEKLGELADNASEYYEQGRDKMERAQDSIENCIMEKPIKSVLVALGIGLLLGRFFMRR